MERINMEDRAIIKNYIGDYFFNPSECALSRTLEGWYLNKNKIIKDMFKDKYKIEIELGLSDNFWLRQYFEAGESDLCNVLEEFSDSLAKLEEVVGFDLLNFARLTENFSCISLRELEENISFNDYFFQLENLKTGKKYEVCVKKGTKVMKTLKKVGQTIANFHAELDLEQFPSKDAELALVGKMFYKAMEEYDRGLSSFKFERKRGVRVVLSVHPMDYLTVSGPNYSWSSCFAPDGDYSGCVLPLLLSENTVIAYIESNTWADDSKTFKKKIWRQYITFNEEGLVFGRQYPQNNNLAENSILDFLKEKFKDYGILNFHENTVQGKVNCIYNDYSSNFTSYGFKEPDSYKKNIDVDYNGSYCMGCGDFFEEGHESRHSLTCPGCSGMMRCEHCDDWVDEDYAYTLDNGECMCGYCFDSYGTACSCCDSYFHVDDTEMDENGNAVCRECLDLHYHQCDECGNLTPKEDALILDSGEVYCSSCQSLLEVCPFCKETHHENYTVEKYADVYCCTNCEDRVHKCNNCGKVVLEDYELKAESQDYLCAECKK